MPIELAAADDNTGTSELVIFLLTHQKDTSPVCCGLINNLDLKVPIRYICVYETHSAGPCSSISVLKRLIFVPEICQKIDIQHFSYIFCPIHMYNILKLLPYRQTFSTCQALFQLIRKIEILSN